ncbi:MAG TPA: VWA domain-containing protein, partial [Planctomycetaceae bacterium]
MLPRRRVCLRLFVVCGLTALSVWSLAGETRPTMAVPASRLIRFDVPGGESLFALSIKAAPVESTDAHDVAIVVDTSASQSGEYGRQALAVLESCLVSLNASDRVRLFAVDTQIKSLSADFAAPQSPETKAALAALQQRVPLGATDLQPALETALRSLQGDRPHSLIYIGDGMSTGKLIEWTGFRTLINEFRRQQVPVTSYAIGPRTDLQVLGILAEHTGGVVLVDALVDDTKLPAEKLGQKLARAAEATVFYADELAVSPEIHKLLPRVVPPIRADRETIVLGEGTIPASLKVTANGAGRSLSWTVKPAAS